jgi:hypothetical protein
LLNPSLALDRLLNTKMKPPNLAIAVLAAGVGLLCSASPDINDERENIKRIKINADALAYAKRLIQEGHMVADKRNAWSEHQPSAEQENEFIRLHDFDEYAKWYLGIDEEHAANTKGRYKFPYGDFQNVHRCAVLAAGSRAGQYKHYDIKNAAAELLGIINRKEGGQVKQPPNPNIQTPKKP